MRKFKEYGLSLLEDLVIQSLLGKFIRLAEGEASKPVIDDVMVLLGKAFGPNDITHFSELDPYVQSDLLTRVPVLKTTHVDWSFLKKVPRTTTTWIGPAPSAKDILCSIGPVKYDVHGVPFPIQDRGCGYVLRGYFTYTFTNGLHIRMGWRYDDVDKYWTLSFSVKFV